LASTSSGTNPGVAVTWRTDSRSSQAYPEISKSCSPRKSSASGWCANSAKWTAVDENGSSQLDQTLCSVTATRLNTANAPMRSRGRPPAAESTQIGNRLNIMYGGHDFFE